LIGPGSVQAQSVCQLPDVKGIASFRTEGRIYVGVWRQSEQKNLLEIYSSQKLSAGERVASFEDDGVYWQSLSSISDGALVGFKIRTTVGEGWFGATKLYVYDGGEFRKVFDSGEVSEVLDLNGDGYPEVIEFLGSQSNPNDEVRISV
jgi:hypothetical protein